MLVFGGAALSGLGGGYGFGEIDDPQGLISHVYERGVRYFDTAPIYGFHKSEQELGRGLKNKDSVIISKAGVSWHSSQRVNLSNEPKIIAKMLEDSLRHLNREYIDIYMIHWPDPRVDVRYSIEVLQKAKEQDKILSIGLCNTNDEEIELAQQISDIEYTQCEFNLFQDGFSPLAKTKLSMGWGTFDKGILSGSVDLNRQFDSSDCRSWAPWWKKSDWRQKVEKVAKFQHDAKSLALHHSLSELDFTICGGKSIAQWDEIFELSQMQVDEHQLKAAREYFAS